MCNIMEKTKNILGKYSGSKGRSQTRYSKGIWRVGLRLATRDGRKAHGSQQSIKNQQKIELVDGSDRTCASGRGEGRGGACTYSSETVVHDPGTRNTPL